MKTTRIIAAFLFVDFLALNLYALYSAGGSGLLDLMTTLSANPWGIVAMVDIVLSLGIVLTLIWADARRRGQHPIATTLMTATLGSLGPLFYFMTRDTDASDPIHGASPSAT